MYTNLPTSQGYIFRILQHFATKLCSFSNFDNFFPEISFVIPRLKFFLKRKSPIIRNFVYWIISLCQNMAVTPKIAAVFVLLLKSRFQRPTRRLKFQTRRSKRKQTRENVCG